MRNSLKHSLLDTPAEAGESFRYPAGSVVICNACAVPVAVLEHGIAAGAKGGRMVRAFRPLSAAHLDELARRTDCDAGVVAWARGLTPDERKTYLGSLHEFKTGDPMLCPVCHQCFVQVIATERDAVLDKAYVVELVTIPPPGQRAIKIRGKRIGARADWVHEHAKAVH